MCLCFGLRSEPTKISVTGAVVSPDASQKKGTENRLWVCFSGVSVSETCYRYQKVDAIHNAYTSCNVCSALHWRLFLSCL